MQVPSWIVAFASGAGLRKRGVIAGFVLAACVGSPAASRAQQGLSHAEVPALSRDPAQRFGANVFGDALSKTGAISKLAPARKKAAKRLGLWNTSEIEARGRRIVVRLNGEPVRDFIDPGPRSVRGYVSLRYRTGRVQFRDVRTAEL